MHYRLIEVSKLCYNAILNALLNISITMKQVDKCIRLYAKSVVLNNEVLNLNV